MMRILLVLFIFSSSLLQGQLLDSVALQVAPVHTSLKDALKEPDKVVRLHLKKLKLDSIPPEVFSLPNLQELDVSRNRITYLSPDIAKLKNLQVLNISSNKLEKLPHEIGELGNLKKLFANRNNIISLPPTIGELSQLRLLDLWSNDIGHFPEEMSKLTSLRKLDLRNIVINEENRKLLKEMLPNTKIYLDPDCKCGN
jgi:Leucine-rich repeat (LRR) protein